MNSQSIKTVSHEVYCWDSHLQLDEPHPSTQLADYATILSQLRLLHGNYVSEQQQSDDAFRSNN